MREIRKPVVSSPIADKLGQLNLSPRERNEALAALRIAEDVADVLVRAILSVRHALARLTPKPGLGA